MSIAKFYMLDAALASRKKTRSSDKILLTIIRYHIEQKADCKPSIRTLAMESGLDRVTVLASISRLEAAGLLVVDRRGHGKSNHYRVMYETGGETPPVEGTNRPESATTGGCETTPEPVEKHHHNKTEQLKQTNNNSVADEVVDELKAIGACGPGLKAVLELSNLTLARVRRLIQVANANKARSIPAYVVKLLEQGVSGLPERPTPKVLADYVNKGMVDSICGFQIERPYYAGHNSKGLHLFEDENNMKHVRTFSPNELRKPGVAT